MVDSLEFKKVCETTHHVERAMRATDWCLSASFEGDFIWAFRSIETTGVRKTNPKPFAGEIKAHELDAATRITGEVAEGKVGMTWPVEITVRFAGHEGPHDPSGNLVQYLDIQRVEVIISYTPPKTFVFIKDSLPVGM